MTVTTGSGTVNFDGGILKPYNAGSTTWIYRWSRPGNVYIKEGGATFDTNGYDMGIGMALQHGGSDRHRRRPDQDRHAAR